MDRLSHYLRYHLSHQRNPCFGLVFFNIVCLSKSKNLLQPNRWRPFHNLLPHFIAGRLGSCILLHSLAVFDCWTSSGIPPDSKSFGVETLLYIRELLRVSRPCRVQHWVEVLLWDVFYWISSLMRAPFALFCFAIFRFFQFIHPACLFVLHSSIAVIKLYEPAFAGSVWILFGVECIPLFCDTQNEIPDKKNKEPCISRKVSISESTSSGCVSDNHLADDSFRPRRTSVKELIAHYENLSWGIIYKLKTNCLSTYGGPF